MTVTCIHEARFDDAEFWIAAKNFEAPFPNTQKRCQLTHERSRRS